MTEKPFYDPATWAPYPELDRLLTDKEVGPEDTEKVKAFAEFLRNAGKVPRKGQPDERTDAQTEWTRKALADPEWRAFILGSSDA